MGMGLLTKGINEVIAVSGKNAAPVGIINRKDLSVVLFKGSHTFEKVAKNKLFAANFIYDSFLYAKTAFEDLDDEFFEEQSFGGYTFYTLKGAEAWILFEAEEVRITNESCIYSLRPLKETVVSPVIHPVNRGFNSIIDAAVHATRYVHSGDENLKKLIEYDLSVAKKCGGERELLAAEFLRNYIE
ncbi:hypothetical protein J2128_000148 [Methanomicrobium sp. W14]|uniref:DUF447 domain-containing protein n=1 Tax=Methanomicrobium sp. W14 TaxID=2817839 RepID=UPI001FD987CE|nr:DUF447 domain-containing protein [Methanomicrobium sp. W14]MBP2132227.1 hypothetical protein [Methanomicrobium sp. W14]